MHEGRTEAPRAIRLTGGELVRVLLADLRRMHAHASDPSAHTKSPEELATFFRAGVEAALRSATLLALALDHSGTSAKGQRPDALSAEPAPLTFAALAAIAKGHSRGAEAVGVVAALAGALARWFDRLSEARDAMRRAMEVEPQQQEQEPPGLTPALAAVDATIGLFGEFQDVQREHGDLPLRRLHAALVDVRRGIRPELLTPVSPVGRAVVTDGAKLKAFAASCVVARRCAGKPLNLAASEVAAMLSGVKLTRTEQADSRLARIGMQTVRRWSLDASRGELKPSLAQERFDQTAELVGLVTGRRPAQSPPPKIGGDWEAVAAALDVVLRSFLDGQPTDFALSGAVETKRQAARQAAAEDQAESSVSPPELANRRIG